MVCVLAILANFNFPINATQSVEKFYFPIWFQTWLITNTNAWNLKSDRRRECRDAVTPLLKWKFIYLFPRSYLSYSSQGGGDTVLIYEHGETAESSIQFESLSLSQNRSSSEKWLPYFTAFRLYRNFGLEQMVDCPQSSSYHIITLKGLPWKIQVLRIRKRSRTFFCLVNLCTIAPY